MGMNYAFFIIVCIEKTAEIANDAIQCRKRLRNIYSTEGGGGNKTFCINGKGSYYSVCVFKVRPAQYG